MLCLPFSVSFVLSCLCRFSEALLSFSGGNGAVIIFYYFSPQEINSALIMWRWLLREERDEEGTPPTTQPRFASLVAFRGHTKCKFEVINVKMFPYFAAATTPTFSAREPFLRFFFRRDFIAEIKKGGNLLIERLNPEEPPPSF